MEANLSISEFESGLKDINQFLPMDWMKQMRDKFQKAATATTNYEIKVPAAKVPALKAISAMKIPSAEALKKMLQVIGKKDFQIPSNFRIKSVMVEPNTGPALLIVAERYNPQIVDLWKNLVVSQAKFTDGIGQVTKKKKTAEEMLNSMSRKLMKVDMIMRRIADQIDTLEGKQVTSPQEMKKKEIKLKFLKSSLVRIEKAKELAEQQIDEMQSVMRQLNIKEEEFGITFTEKVKDALSRIRGEPLLPEPDTSFDDDWETGHERSRTTSETTFQVRDYEEMEITTDGVTPIKIVPKKITKGPVVIRKQTSVTISPPLKRTVIVMPPVKRIIVKPGITAKKPPVKVVVKPAAWQNWLVEMLSLKGASF